jgi:hypothetical protein
MIHFKKECEVNCSVEAWRKRACTHQPIDPVFINHWKPLFRPIVKVKRMATFDQIKRNLFASKAAVRTMQVYKEGIFKMH